MEQSNDLLTDTRERAEELMHQVRDHLARQQFEAALATLGTLHPADQAELLTELGDEQQHELLKSLAPEESAKILEQMRPEDAAKIFGEMAPAVLSDILDEARPDVAADLLKQLPERQSQQALEEMEGAREVTPLLEYPDESAGGIMTPEYVSVRDDMTAAIALDSIRIFGTRVEGIGSIIIVDEGSKTGGLSERSPPRPGAACFLGRGHYGQGCRLCLCRN